MGDKALEKVWVHSGGSWAAEGTLGFHLEMDWRAVKLPPPTPPDGAGRPSELLEIFLSSSIGFNN